MLATRGRLVFSFPVDFEAGTFSTLRWEPSFYQGLLGPALCSALRGCIAYPEGLWNRVPGPEIPWMLSPVTLSSPGPALTTANLLASCNCNPDTGYEVCSLRRSYFASDLHIDSAIDAI